MVGQSGGSTAVINQSLVGVIEAVDDCAAIGRLLGAHHGVRGIVQELFVDLKGFDRERLERVAATPCAALGSTRDKPNEEYCRRIFEVFRKNDVRYFFYIGGNDSADTARIVREMAKADSYDLRVFHIPKTIDNDLRVTDHCPGNGSAARFVALAVMGDDRDNASLTGLKIDVIMGRDAGWLTAASMLARSDESTGPHLIYVPEAIFDIGRFVDDVRAVYDRLGRCVIAVSEGIVCDEKMEVRKADGSVKLVDKPIAVKVAEEMHIDLERDDHGNVVLSKLPLGQFLADYIAERLGKNKPRIRADTFGYVQRSFPGCVSPVDAREARLVGRRAVQYALAGRTSGSVAIRRNEGARYGVSYFRAELADVAHQTKPLPKEYINAAANGINDSFLDYVAPLAGDLPPIGRLFD